MLPANMLKFYIDGQWVDPISKTRMGVENPATEEIVGEIALGTEADADRAILAARAAFDAWTVVPPAQVVDILKKAGVKRAMVSSSNNDGTRMLQDAAPGIIVPELRPYRSRGEISTAPGT